MRKVNHNFLYNRRQSRFVKSSLSPRNHNSGIRAASAGCYIHVASCGDTQRLCLRCKLSFNHKKFVAIFLSCISVSGFSWYGDLTPWMAVSRASHGWRLAREAKATHPQVDYETSGFIRLSISPSKFDTLSTTWDIILLITGSPEVTIALYGPHAYILFLYNTTI